MFRQMLCFLCTQTSLRQTTVAISTPRSATHYKYPCIDSRFRGLYKGDTLFHVNQHFCFTLCHEIADF